MAVKRQIKEQPRGKRKKTKEQIEEILKKAGANDLKISRVLD